MNLLQKEYTLYYRQMVLSETHYFVHSCYLLKSISQSKLKVYITADNIICQPWFFAPPSPHHAIM